ncbi:MAG TPA: trypsin-like serine protease [Sedimenticola sp.]|nr:trypsin-like serine protease [Sedimenticola sp.]
MTPTRSRTAGRRLLLACLLAAFPFSSFSQPGTVESDPSVVRILPKNYPLNRIRVAAHEYPWSAIGLLTMLGGRYSCTGTLIAERYVLTAAHCVFPVRNFPEEINFLGGYEQERYVAHSRAKKLHMSKAFRNPRPSPEVFANDWALVELEKPIGRETGYLGWAYFDAGVLEKMGSGTGVFKVSGYRRDRRFVQTVDHQCRITGFTADGKLIMHRCPITGGDSGGPVLLPYKNELLVVGVDVGVKAQRGPHLKRGEAREGYAVPSAAFRDKLTGLGIGGAPMGPSGNLTGRAGNAPLSPPRRQKPRLTTPSSR